jgi:hypothetical protein
MTRAYTYKSDFKSPQEALEFINSKTSYAIDKGLSSDKEFEFWKFRISPEAEDVIANYRKLTGGADPRGNYDDFLPFKEWALKNQSLVGEKFFNYSKIYENIDKNNFSNEVKRRSLLLSLEEIRKRVYSNGIPEGIEKIEKIIETVKKLDDEQLNRYLKNNADDPMIDIVIKDSAFRLGYGLNIQEMEANFTALIRELMEKGTDKENIGFATWIVDYLKKTNSNFFEFVDTFPYPIPDWYKFNLANGQKNTDFLNILNTTKTLMLNDDKKIMVTVNEKLSKITVYDDKNKPIGYFIFHKKISKYTKTKITKKNMQNKNLFQKYLDSVDAISSQNIQNNQK